MTNEIDKPDATQPKPPTHRSWWQSWAFKAIVGVFVLAIVLLGLGAEYLAHNAEPLLKKVVVEAAEQRLHEPVELDALIVSVVKGLEVQGNGLKVLREDQSTPPVVVVPSFTFHIPLDDLLHLRAHVDTIHLDGLQVHVPPHSIHLSSAQPTDPHPPVKFLWGKVVCQNAVLIIDTDKPGKQPLQFDIHNLQVTNAGSRNPYLYQADVVIPRPQGTVHAFGHFGPWNGPEPRATNLDGVYRFDHADLNTIKGIGGILTSTGKFSGQLGYITVDGTTETPDFSIDLSHHTMPLHTQFHAFVDGTSGDTTLAPVQARLGNSYFTAHGTVMHVRTSPGGHDIALTVDMPRGLMEDLLTLGMKTLPPMMRGAVTMQARLHIPPGHESITQKLQLAGAVKITAVEFTSTKLQDRIDGLSMRAQGHPGEAMSASSDQKAEVASTLSTNFTLASAMMKFTNLHYSVPGAQVNLDGVYSLNGNIFEFGGRVHTEAKASQMVTGWKSVLLKPLDGFLGARDGSGLDLPIFIDGVKSDYSISFRDNHQTVDKMATELAAHTPPGK